MGHPIVWQYFVAWLQLGRIEKLLNQTADALEEVSQREQDDGVSFDIDLEVIVTPEAEDVEPRRPAFPDSPLDVVQLTTELLWQLEHGKLDAGDRHRIEQELIELDPDAWRDYQAARWV